MTIPDPTTNELGKFSFPATPQDGDLAQAAYTTESNNQAIAAYLNDLLVKLQADLTAIVDKINEEHP